MIYLCCSKKKKEENGLLIESLEKNYSIREDIENIEREPASVVVIGGDGTLNYLVNKLPKVRDYNILYFPRGTANDFAKSLKLSMDDCKRSIESVFKNAPLVTVPVMTCNDRSFINVVSFGEPARITSDGTNLLKEYTGKLSYYLSAVDRLIRPEVIELVYTVNGVSKTIKTFGGFVSQGEYVGGGVRVSKHRHSFFKEMFNFTAVNSISVTESLNSLISLQGDIFSSDECLVDNVCEELTIESKKKIKVKLDGEEYENEYLHFKKSPVKLNFYLY